jgi:hypothetical protein
MASEVQVYFFFEGILAQRTIIVDGTLVPFPDWLAERTQLPDVSAIEDLCRRYDLKLWKMHCSQCGTALEKSMYESALIISEERYQQVLHLG